ncbi:hypothetical protein E4T56_gene8341 [Termitomyces sp. T112]|nr:hypothetical protein E4T56_gene8341 [Termitomyces sp. T112]
MFPFVCISIDIVGFSLHIWQDGLPSRDQLVKLCDAHFIEQLQISQRGTSHYVYRSPNSSTPLALIKFSEYVTLSEARMQTYVFHLLKRDASPPFKVPEVYDAWEEHSLGSIVMEYVPGLVATAADIPRIVDAVQWLLTLPPPKDGKLGPVEGGTMRHSLWRDDRGPTYESVEQMDIQFNNVLSFQQLTVNLSAEPICFYHDDISLRNFLVSGPDLHALDFEHTGFAPEWFMNYSIANPPRTSAPIVQHIVFSDSPKLQELNRATYHFKRTRTD